MFSSLISVAPLDVLLAMTVIITFAVEVWRKYLLFHNQKVKCALPLFLFVIYLHFFFICVIFLLINCLWRFIFSSPHYSLKICFRSCSVILSHFNLHFLLHGFFNALPLISTFFVVTYADPAFLRTFYLFYFHLFSSALRFLLCLIFIGIDKPSEVEADIKEVTGGVVDVCAVVPEAVDGFSIVNEWSMFSSGSNTIASNCTILKSGSFTESLLSPYKEELEERSRIWLIWTQLL